MRIDSRAVNDAAGSIFEDKPQGLRSLKSALGLGFSAAETEDGIVMAFEHRTEPVAAVQFHPESIMSLGGDAGMRMIENIVAALPRRAREQAA